MSNLELVERFDSYEDYLDSQLTINDMGNDSLTHIAAVCLSSTSNSIPNSNCNLVVCLYRLPRGRGDGAAVGGVGLPRNR